MLKGNSHLRVFPLPAGLEKTNHGLIPTKNISLNSSINESSAKNGVRGF